ncbi:hypothetical protein KIPE111705_35980 [Kibdelosporangium persicum]
MRRRRPGHGHGHRTPQLISVTGAGPAVPHQGVGAAEPPVHGRTRDHVVRLAGLREVVRRVAEHEQELLAVLVEHEPAGPVDAPPLAGAAVAVELHGVRAVVRLEAGDLQALSTVDVLDDFRSRCCSATAGWCRRGSRTARPREVVRPEADDLQALAAVLVLDQFVVADLRRRGRGHPANRVMPIAVNASRIRVLPMSSPLSVRRERRPGPFPSGREPGPGPLGNAGVSPRSPCPSPRRGGAGS